MLRRAALAVLAILVLAGEARAQGSDPPEWPDPGSEDPVGPKLFPPNPRTEAFDPPAEPDPSAVAEPVYRMSWYGWRNLIGDGASVALAFVAAASGIGQILIGSTLTYAVGGPIAHFTAGSWGRALISLGARIAGPLLFGLVGRAVSCAASRCNDLTSDPAVVISALIGGFAAASFDDAWLARRQVVVTPAIGLETSGSKANGPRTLRVSVPF